MTIGDKLRKLFSKKQERSTPPLSSAISQSTFGIEDLLTDPIHNMNYVKDWVWACVNIRANQIAKTPMNVVYYKNQHDVYDVTDHEIYDLFRKVNDNMTGFEFKYLLASAYDVVGNANVFVETDDNFKNPKSLHIIYPEYGRMKVFKNKFGTVEKYELWTGPDKITFNPLSIIHLKAPSIRNSTYGVGLVQSLVRLAVIDDRQKLYIQDAFSDGALVQAAVSHPNSLGPAEHKQAEEKLNQSYQAKMRKKLMLLDGGATISKINLTPQELQSVDMLIAIRDQIINLSGVPRPALGIDSTTRADADAQMAAFIRWHINPLLSVIDAKFTQDLAERYYPQPVGRLAIEHKDTTPEDALLKFQLRQIQQQIGYTTINEMLILDGKEPIGEDGDKRYISAGLTDITEEPLDLSAI